MLGLGQISRRKQDLGHSPGKQRLTTLHRLANSVYGPSQQDLWTFYITWIRSKFEHGSPAWFPFVSRSQLNKLEVIQRKAARLALGVRPRTRNNDLLLEANLLPLECRFRQQTANLAEKYRRFPPDDPLFALSHQALPPLRLRRNTGEASWQFASVRILTESGFWPARNDVHVPCPHDLISLGQNRLPFRFTNAFDPWDLEDYDDRISVSPQLGNVTQQSSHVK